MNRTILSKLTVGVTLLLVTNLALAQKPNTGLALQGFTGLLNTPNAEITPEGKLNFQLNTEPNVRLSDQFTRNELLSFGFFSNLEFAGRIWLQDGPQSNSVARDLSANIKLQLLSGRQSIAIGTQDIGGGAPNFRTSYLVGSQRLGPTRVSFGYGTGPDRMDGMFGGLEWTVFNHFDILAEHDNADNNLGFRLHTPKEWLGYGIQLSFIGKQALGSDTNDKFEYGIGFTIPLGSKHYSAKPIALPNATPTANSSYPDLTSPALASPALPPVTALSRLTPAIADPIYHADNNDLSVYEDLGRKLVELGLENLRIGVTDRDIYVEYENHRYNHNELDALGVVLGTVATKTPSSLTTMAVLIKKDNIPVLEITVPLAGYRDFLAGPRNSKNPSIWPPSVGALWSQMTIRPVTHHADGKNIRWLNLAEQNRPWARLTLGPGITYFLATEVSVFDYALTLNPELEIPLWPGGVLSAAWQLPVSNSKNLDEDGAYSFFRPKQEMTHLWLQQGIRPAANVFGLIGVGTHYRDKADYVGVFNDIVWVPGAGNHRLRAQLGYFDNNGNPREQWYLEEHKQREIYLGSYRYFYAPLDLALEATYGHFWYKDQGTLLKATRFFGDTSVAIYYKDDGEWRAGGVEVSLPLTPRRGMQPKNITVNGKENWMIGLETTISTPGEANIVNPNLLIVPRFPRTLDRNYLNRDRLSADYIRTHLLRLREAYARWGLTNIH